MAQSLAQITIDGHVGRNTLLVPSVCPTRTRTSVCNTTVNLALTHRGKRRHSESRCTSAKNPERAPAPRSFTRIRSLEGVR